jgi:putative oxidoreductase
MNKPTNNQDSSKARNVALWALQIVTAAVFLVAGFARLSGQPMAVEMFDKVGIGQWFRYVTGGIEITSAILLLIPSLTAVGAALLLCTMAGAVLAQLLLIGDSALPALVLLSFAAIILWGRIEILKALLRKLPAVQNLITSSPKEGARIKVGDVFENPVTGERQ